MTDVNWLNGVVNGCIRVVMKYDFESDLDLV